MKTMILSAAVCIGISMALTSCSTSAEPLEPIPGSITYGGQPSTKLTKSPVGSTIKHRFPYRTGTAEETYVIQPDRSLKLIRRDILPDISFSRN
ncbi:hypothetical protein QO002_001069 [Pararhizobium capsulatum DSM 1112]|uniref:Transmembrane protein n=1 Tax=Pararhizobium capsulatum DSM 1112 TaxID=1121113 RepID=A0ABU0BKZ8_9HYPH|nr:hypothetical protein [Pararhizobium capsulatum]MDQ0318931.1 hypothetical protein [Pararhizobium capsulatum DSM 1112]